MVLRPTQKEMAYKYVFGLLNMGDMTLPHYWSNLFIAMQHLLSEEDMTELKHKIADVERMCGSKIERKRNGSKKILPQMSLYEIEIYLFNSFNLKSYFLVDGEKVTQFEIERKLFEIKEWCFDKVNTISRDILFTKPPL